MRVEITIKKIVDTETDMVPCYLMSAITMNFDGESIVFDDLGAATPLLPMCVRKKSACYAFAELQDMSSLHLWQIMVKQYC